jgi:hypothetical protein
MKDVVESAEESLLDGSQGRKLMLEGISTGSQKITKL